MPCKTFILQNTLFTGLFNVYIWISIFIYTYKCMAILTETETAEEVKCRKLCLQ